MKGETSNLSFDRAKRRSIRLKWSALAGLCSSGAIAVISIFSAPITINYLGKDLYGIWAIITSFLIWAQLFDFGILNGLTNALAEAFGRDDYQAAQSYICTTFLTTTLISVAGLILWIFGSLYFPWSKWIRVDTFEQEVLLGKGICIVGCFFFLTLPFLINYRILHANQRLYFYHIINLTSYIFTLIILIVGVYLKFDLLALLIATSAVPLIIQAFCWCILSKKVAWVKFSWKYVHFDALKRVANSSIPILVIQVITIITSQIIPILLTSVTTLKEVADFSILWKIYIFVFVMMTNISSAYNPGFRDAFERGEIHWIKKSLKRLIVFQAFLIILGCSPLLFAGNTIIATWIRMPLEHPLGFIGWCTYAFCILFAVMNVTMGSVLIIFDKIAPQIILTLLSSITLFMGIIHAMPRFGLITIFGIIGLTSLISFCYSFIALRHALNNKVILRGSCG